MSPADENRAVTIYDVAKAAKVSPATVSRVYNGTPVSDAKSARVRDAADKLGYRANRTARSLRMRSSEMIALIIPDIENPFFTSVARGVENRAREAGFSVVLCNSGDDVDIEARYLDVAVLEQMAGVIIAVANESSDLSRVAVAGRPLVAIDRRSESASVDTVVLDNFAGGADATQRLIDAGRRRIACITGPADVETAVSRLEGWQSAMRENGLSIEGLQRHADYRVEGGRAAMAELLEADEAPDAVFVANNMMTIGALQALSASKTPLESVALASFGDLPYAMFEHSGVLVVPLPARELGSAAADMLLGRIAGDLRAPQDLVIGTDRARASFRQLG